MRKLKQETAGKWYPWIILLCCCGQAGATVGLGINSAGVFYRRVSEALAVGMGTVSLYSTIVNLTTGFTCPFAAILARKRGTRLIVPAACAGAALGYLGLSRITAVWQIYALAVLIGFCNAFFGIVIISAILGNWFAKKDGLVRGVANSFGGIIGAIISPLISSLISSIGFRNAYLVPAGLVIAFMVPSLLLLAYAPGDVGLLPYGYSEMDAGKARNQGTDKHNEKSTTKLFGTAFVAYCAAGAMATFITGMGSHMSGFGTSVGLSAQMGAYLISMVMIGNTGSKLVGGALSDAIGAKRTAVLVYVLPCAGLAALVLLAGSGSMLMLPAALLLGIIYSAVGVVLFGVAKEIFGPERGGDAYSFMTSCAYVSSAASYAVIGYVYDFTGSYVPAIVFCAALAVAAIVLILAAYRAAPQREAEK